MNRFINAALVFLFIPTLLLAIFIGFDLPIRILKTSGANLPYRKEALLALGLIFFILILRRTIRRYMGLRIVSKTEKFKWSKLVSKDRKKRVFTYTFLEGLVMVCAGSALLVITPEAWAPGLAILFGAVDGFVFAFLGLSTNMYRVGLSSKALIVADREVILLYFTGLRKVSIHQQSIYFDYIKGLQLSFASDCIPAEDRDEFFDQLEAQLDPDKVFISRK